MRLNAVPSKIRLRLKKRIARGGKRGSYSGRGTKGQKSRAGRKLRPMVRDLILRIPKQRGFRNKGKNVQPIIFNLFDLELILKSGAGSKTPMVIDKELLIQTGKVSASHVGGIKILSEGEITSPVMIKGLLVSKRTQEKIKKAGGSVDTGVIAKPKVKKIRPAAKNAKNAKPAVKK